MRTTITKTLMAAFLSAMALLFAVGCGEKEPPVISVSSVSLSKTSITIKEGSSESLSATVSPSDAQNKAVSWSSSNSSVATVDNSGRVTGVKAGSATITVTTSDGGKTATCSVTVEANIINVTGVTLDKTTAQIPLGGDVTLAATVAPADATDKSVTWTSSDEAVAKVSGGKVTAVAVGKATITAKTNDGGKIATCEVSVIKPVESITISDAETMVPVEGEVTLTVTVTPEDATIKDIEWSSSDESIAKVDATGKVTGVAEGTATITAKTVEGGKTATCKVTVGPKEVPVEGVEFAEAEVTVIEGESAVVSVTFTPAGATNKNVTYESSDEEVATVDAEGNVTGVKPGQATITVTTEDGGKTAECVVTVEKAPVKVTGVELNYKERTINIGNAGTLIATVLPKDATNKNVTWTVSDESVLKVQDGVVTPKKEGTATVTVTTEDGGFTATCEVTATAKVVAVSGVKLDKTSQTIYVGDGFQLKATISPTNASNPEVTWTSSKESVAKVDKTGKVTGVAAGTATITAKTANGKTATCAVTVSKKLVSLITLNVTSKTIDIGDTFKITPTITPSDAANKAVTWSSNNTSIATVDSNGNVKGLKSGTAVITCKAKDGSNTKASCSVTVKSYEIRHIVYRNQQIALNEVLPSNVNYIMETANGWNMVYFRLVDKTTNQPVDVSTSTLANNVVISSSNKNVVGDATNYTNYERGCYVYGEGTATLTFKYKGVTLGTTTVTVSHSYEIRYNNSSLPSSITFNWENSSDWVNFKLYDRVDKKYVSPLDHSKKLGIQSSSLVAYLGYNNEYFQLKPKNYGSDTINFTYNGEVIGSVTLKIVNPRAITSIDFTNYSVSTVTGTRAVTVSVGSTRTVSANITPSNADTSTLEWTTANNDYAKVVSYSGKSCTVRGVAKGNIQLICRDKATGKSSMLGIIVQ